MRPEQMTILTVDDTPANIRLLTHYLEKQGYRVLTAEDGFEGFKAAIQHHPDLVLLDVMMPGTDGYEVCELLKAEEETKDIPIMFLTAKAEVEDRIRGFELGAVDYITKPFNLTEISTRLRTHLRLKYLEKERLQTRKILLQTQKLASLGKSGTVFVDRLSGLTEKIGKGLKSEAGVGAGVPALVAEMDRLLGDLKSFSNATASDMERILVSDLVDGVLDLMSPVVQNNVRFEVEWPKVSPVVTGNIGMIHQTVLNLGLNALESAVSGGNIQVRISEGPRVAGGGNPAEGESERAYACIAMVDAAPRKEPLSLDSATGLFSTAKNNLNAGIRLTAMNAILLHHKGFLELTQSEGRTTVAMFLPTAA
jgi:CheY-like chemotaxis protein